MGADPLGAHSSDHLTGAPMRKLDAQIHVWLTDRPSRPWDPTYRDRYSGSVSFLQHAGQSNSVQNTLTEMAEAGVDGAVLTTLGVYGASNDMELEASSEFPDRFCAVGVVDHFSPGLEETLSVQMASGLRGIRIPGLRTAAAWAGGEFHTVLQLCDSLGLAVMLPAYNPALSHHLPNYPRSFFFLNHMGTGLAPPIVGYREPDPFILLDDILSLATVPNVGLKLTGIPALSQERFPFRDIWSPILQTIKAFGAERLAWGSDYTRTAGLHSYHDAARYLEEITGLSDADLQLIHAGTISDRLNWHPA